MGRQEQKQGSQQHNACCARGNTAITNFSKELDFTLLLYILPEDIWHTILEILVQDANDYFHFCEASPFFTNLLAARRVYLLLTPVMQALLHHREHWEWTQDRWDLQATGEDPRVQLKDFANCRLVCRDWKNATESVLHNLPYHYYFAQELDRLDYQFPIQVFQQYSEVFDSQDELTKFESYFQDSHFANETNPFVTRAVGIRIPFCRPDLHEAFMPTCLNFLHKCGNHVWYLTIRGNLHFSLGPSQNELCQILSDVLEHVPNLKGLRFDIVGLPFESWLPLDLTFPPLRNLVFFDVLASPSRIVDGILLSSNPTKVGLTFHHETCSNAHEKFTSFCQSCTSVTNLRIDLCQTEVYCDGIFSKLETHFGEKLTSLVISLPDKGLLETRKKSKLPHLKVLELKLEDAVPLDFLLGMTNCMEEITVKVRRLMGQQHLIWLQSKERALWVYEAVQHRQLCMSNVWKLFPKLKKFSVAGQEKFSFVVKSTREEYKSNLRKFRAGSRFQNTIDQPVEETYSTILECSIEEKAEMLPQRKKPCIIT